MTTINSSSYGYTLTVRKIDGEYMSLVAARKTPMDGRVIEHSAAYKTADLLAALGIDKLGCGCDEADENLKAALARAEKAEATLARIEDVRREFYEVRGDWATVHGAAALKAQMERAILGDPPFTLPTETGAGIVARHVSGYEYELRLFSDGKWYDTSGGDYWPDDLMKPSLWTKHRLTEEAP